MADTAPFGGIVRDLSNAVGFQFEFVCIRCGNGYRSSFIAASAIAADAGGYAAGKVVGKIPIFGDFLGDTASDMVKDKAKDAALNRATAEVAPAFAQCPRCGRWRCRAVCWNAAVNLCVDCAPRQQVAQPAPMYAPIAPGYAPPTAPGYAPPTGGYAPPAPPMYVPPPVVYPQVVYATAQPVVVQTYVPPPPPPLYTSGIAVASFLSGLAIIPCGIIRSILAVNSIYTSPGAIDVSTLILGLSGFLALLAIVLGHVALVQVSRGKGQVGGGGMAVTGLVLGYVFVGLFALSWLINSTIQASFARV